jgi:hypothetical protein
MTFEVKVLCLIALVALSLLAILRSGDSDVES